MLRMRSLCGIATCWEYSFKKRCFSERLSMSSLFGSNVKEGQKLVERKEETDGNKAYGSTPNA